MGRIIREQVITSTGVDLDGESFSRAEIVALFERMSDNQPLVVRHDMSTEPIARSFNKVLKELANRRTRDCRRYRSFQRNAVFRVRGHECWADPERL